MDAKEHSDGQPSGRPEASQAPSSQAKAPSRTELSDKKPKNKGLRLPSAKQQAPKRGPGAASDLKAESSTADAGPKTDAQGLDETSDGQGKCCLQSA